MKHKKQKIHITALGLVVISMLISGSNSVALKFATDTMEPMVFAGLRALAVSAILLLFVNNYRRIFSPKIILKTLPGALLLFAFLSLNATGISQSGALKASMMSLTTPMFVYLFAVFLLHEPLIKRIFFGGMITLSGSLLLIGAPALAGQPLLISDGLLLLSYACLAGVTIHGKYMYKWLTANELLSIRFLISGILLTTFTFTVLGPSALIVGSGSAWLTLLYSIIFGGLISNTLYYRGLSKLKAEQTAPLFYLEPMTGTVLATLLLGETLALSALVGVATILSGVILAYPHHNHLMHHYMQPHASRIKRLLHKLLHSVS